ncbi:MAG: NAD(P)-binding domain-containing protein, partial [Kosmotoga sp.]|nr:NAD(P)-binding domain-containing protein [Kosmotoga sp.]
MKVGIIGIGNIGSILLKRFLQMESPLKLYVFNRSPQKLDPYRELGNVV